MTRGTFDFGKGPFARFCVLVCLFYIIWKARREHCDIEVHITPREAR